MTMRAQARAVPVACLLFGGLVLALPSAAAAAARQPLGLVEQTLGRFDPDTLAPVGPSLEVQEPHTAPVPSPDRQRLALGLSAAPASGNGGRIGLWIVERARMRVLRAVATGIAAEAVAYPGVIAALLQNGELVIVDPATGAITRRRSIGSSHCSPPAVAVGRRGVFVNEVRPDGVVEIAVVDARGRVALANVRLKVAPSASECRIAPLVADPAGRRVFVIGTSRVAVVDVLTRRVSFHAIGDRGLRRTAALLPGGGLAVAGDRGLRVLDTRRWTLRWRDASARSVLVSGRTVLAFGGRIRARDARDGRLRWTASGDATLAGAVAAGRVYVSSARALRILDLATGRLRGVRAPIRTQIKLV